MVLTTEVQIYSKIVLRLLQRDNRVKRTLISQVIQKLRARGKSDSNGSRSDCG